MPAKKLIEVALPLKDINHESAREKSLRHGHPSTLHLWWSRKPLATTRAVIWASLVDDPSSHPEKFPTEEAQDKERKRLFAILSRLVLWKNSSNPATLKAARDEILKSTGNNPPDLLDPFAGGGSIPLEAQRLGLRVHARDLNPVAVIINKAMIEIPPKFSGNPPVNPESRREIGSSIGWSGSSGLARDVKYYGARMKDEAFRIIGHMYPKISTPEGDSTVIAWIWARTVKCPNPACGCDMPLVNSFVLSKKLGRESYIEPVISGGEIRYEVRHGKNDTGGTVTRSGAKCICCGAPVDFGHIRGEAKAGRMGASLMAVVAEGTKGRLYISPNDEHIKAADVPLPDDYPDADLPHNTRDFKTPNYGMPTFASLFTPRQLTMLTTFSDLIPAMREEIENDALNLGMNIEYARAYAEAVSVYLAFVVDKLTNFHVSLCIWDNTRDNMGNCFGRQALPMIWNFAEGNPFSDSSGCFSHMLNWVCENIEAFPAGFAGEALQNDAQNDSGLRNMMISTDPPYYDNISYADLSDFFYIWLRKNLRDIYPSLFMRMLTPKNNELIASPYRHDKDIDRAKSFFEDGMLTACKNLYTCASDEYPITIYYAYKQKDTQENEQEAASSGWETMLTAVIKAGFVIVATWPMRTEMTTALKTKRNYLSSSIILVCRKRPNDAPISSRKNFTDELKTELPPALKILQDGNIAPVDISQSAIGLGMSVYSRYSAVNESDGTPVTVRMALQIINKALDEIVGEFDKETQFCIGLYAQEGFGVMRYGDADILARAKNVSVDALADMGIVRAKGGDVSLIKRSEIEIKVSNEAPSDWVMLQRLAFAMSKGGREACAKIVAPLRESAERARRLAYVLHGIAERRGWNDETYAYNSLVMDWPEIMREADKLKDKTAEQLSIGFEQSMKGESE